MKLFNDETYNNLCNSLVEYTVLPKLTFYGSTSINKCKVMTACKISPALSSLCLILSHVNRIYIQVELPSIWNVWDQKCFRFQNFLILEYLHLHNDTSQEWDLHKIHLCFTYTSIPITWRWFYTIFLVCFYF
jgi:hypothetical protein